MQQTVRVCHGSDPGVSHPLAGFLAPLELAGLLRPAAVPGLRSPFRAFPSRQVAHPSSGSLAPLPFVPVEPRCGARGLVTTCLHRLGRRSGVVPGRILPWLEAPFQPRSSHSLSTARLARPPGHPGPRAPDPPRSGRSVDFEAFFPARVRSHRAAVTRRAEAGALLGVPRPSRALLPPDLGPSFTRHGRRRPSSRWQRAPLGASRDPGDLPASGHFSWLAPRALRWLETLDVGWTPRGRPKRPSQHPSAVTGSLDPGRAALRQQPRLP